MLTLNFCARHQLSRLIGFVCISVFMLSTIVLTGCGLSDERGNRSGETAQEQDGGSRSEESDFLFKETIGIRAERINGQFNRIGASQISIVTLDQNFNEVASRAAPAHRVVERFSDELEKNPIGFEIQFVSNYIQRLNQVVKVTFDQNATPPEFLYAPLYKLSQSESITVSAKSHYVLKKLFDTINDGDALEKLLPCSGSETDCLNQAKAKVDFLKQISIATNTSNITLNPAMTVQQALDFLDAQLDLRLNVEAAVNEITRSQSPFSRGIRRDFTFELENALDLVSRPRAFNALFFGLSFSELTPGDSNRSVNIASSSSKIVPANTFGNDKIAYPLFTQTTSLLDMRKDILSSDIPFARTSYAIRQDQTTSINDNEPINFLTTNLTDTLLSTEGFLLNERVMLQSTPSDSSDPGNIGWEFEPVFTRNYQVNDTEPVTADVEYGNAATWLTSSNYSKAASYQLSISGEQASRQKQLEDSHLFSWEVHGLESTQNLTLSPFNGKEYGVISYSLKFNDEINTQPLMLIAETAQWKISGAKIAITQPGSHYHSQSLSRTVNNVSTGVIPEVNMIEASRDLVLVATKDDNGERLSGRISLDGLNTPEGHATENGKYIALVFNTKDRLSLQDKGQGIILASELSNDNFIFTGEQYQLQGNSFEINDSHNILHNFNGSTLTVNQGQSIAECQAQIALKRTSVAHTVDPLENTLSAPAVTSGITTTSQACSLNGSEIQIEFAQVFNQPLTLRGFVTFDKEDNTTTPGNLINFIWEQNNQLGLIFANKSQSLNPAFD